MTNNAKVAILVQATNSYYQYIQNLVESINRYFLLNTQKDVFIFTNHGEFQQKLGDKCEVYQKKCEPYDKATFYFDIILDYKNILQNYDFCIKLDADMFVYDYVAELEFLPTHEENLLATQHFISYSHYRDAASVPIYWQSCVFGGRTKQFIECAEVLKDKIHEDRALSRLWPAWEEVYINWYFAKVIQTVKTLGVNYASPLLWHTLKPEHRESYNSKNMANAVKIYHYNHYVKLGAHPIG